MYDILKLKYNRSNEKWNKIKVLEFINEFKINNKRVPNSNDCMNNKNLPHWEIIKKYLEVNNIDEFNKKYRKDN